MISDGDPFLEKELRRMSIYDFYHRIFTLKKNQKKETIQSGESYGFGAQ